MYVAVVPPSYRSNPILDELHPRLGTIEARLGQYARVTHSASYEAGRFQASTGAHGRGLMHEITILSTMGHALHLPERSHASDLAQYRDKSNALYSMKNVMHHRIQTQF